jgi:hypothetical protein
MRLVSYPGFLIFEGGVYCSLSKHHMANTALSPSYAAAVRALLRFSAGMMVAGSLAGLVFREMRRVLPAGEMRGPDAPPSAQIALREAQDLLNLVHGHVFQMGVFIPIACAASLVLSKLAGAPEIREKSLRVAVRLTRMGAAAATALLVWKAFWTALAVRDACATGGPASVNMVDIEASLFGGSRALRAILYAVAHLMLGGGCLLCCFPPPVFFSVPPVVLRVKAVVC